VPLTHSKTPCEPPHSPLKRLYTLHTYFIWTARVLGLANPTDGYRVAWCPPGRLAGATPHTAPTSHSAARLPPLAGAPACQRRFHTRCPNGWPPFPPLQESVHDHVKHVVASSPYVEVRARAWGVDCAAGQVGACVQMVVGPGWDPWVLLDVGPGSSGGLPAPSGAFNLP